MIVEGKTIVVSGVGYGLGREVAAAALRDGANVVIGARTAANLEKIAGELDPSGERLAWQPTDITDRDQCAALAGRAVDRFGRIDGLVNCAALDAIFGGLADADWDDWRKAIDINLLGTMQMTQAVLPALREQGGSVVLIGTQSVYRCQVPQLAYAATKAGLLGAVTHLVHELGPHRIRVNIVTPSWMWGPPVEAYVAMTSQARSVEPETVVGEITAGMPLGEIPSDGDVAEAALFFLSDRSRMITGQTLLVNAGEYLR
jgi:NAD(P)-dependent dehydrogenase (short-subunit alcohol dehydrogenase family)